jgi:hypothetical protein
MKNTDPGGLQNVDSALKREVDRLARRFPDVDLNEIDQHVRQAYADLSSRATIRSHLVTLTAARVGNLLRQGRVAAGLGERPNETSA